MATNRQSEGRWSRLIHWSTENGGVLILAGFTLTWLLLMGLMMWIAFGLVGIAY
ncbi:MAG TPA: hypothetical protein VFJ19_19420 [Nocardioidaceae bacterium]|nr:hypothetical protein [Nocardioidaceae bacterium]